jgi:hypothetical protein
MTECYDKSDCEVRVRQCCECGGDTEADQVIALPAASFDEYQRMVCDRYPPTCDACQPEYPSTEGFGYIADIYCSSGHCRVHAAYVDPAF